MMTSDDLQKVAELEAVHYQLYELIKKSEMILSSLKPKRKPQKKFSKASFEKEFALLQNARR
jgi:hypothetical protein